jgi:CBS domain-containing protein
MDRHPRLAKDIMVTRLVRLSPDRDVFKAIGLLLKHRISGAPVVDDKRNYVGVFSEKCCMSVLASAIQVASQADDGNRKTAAAKKLAKDIMVTRLTTLSPEMDVFQAIGYLLKNRISGAPVVDNGKLVGVFSERYCMRVLIESAYEQLPTAEVSAFMDKDLGRTIPEDMDLLSIARIFLDTHYRRLPVLRDGRLVGQISRRDVLLAAHKLSSVVHEREAALLYLRSHKHPDGGLSDEADAPLLTVFGFMDSDAKTITEDIDLLSIAQIFLNTNFRRLPVLREGKLIGQISRRDLLRAAHDALAVPPEHEKSLLYLSSLVDRSDAPVG